MESKTYRAKREIKLQFKDMEHGPRYHTIDEGDILTGEVHEDFLYIEFGNNGPARIPLALLEEVK